MGLCGLGLCAEGPHKGIFLLFSSTSTPSNFLFHCLAAWSYPYFTGLCVTGKTEECVLVWGSCVCVEVPYKGFYKQVSSLEWL